MNNPFEYNPEEECREAFRLLVKKIETLKRSENPDDINFRRELEAGKMLGVLIAQDLSGEKQTLYAFSGQLGNGGFHFPGFVGPVFDYLQPDGYFKTKERDISRQNKDISRFEDDQYNPIKEDYERQLLRNNQIIEDFKEKCRLSKIKRDSLRAAGNANEAELIRQSQFEKAELHRLKKRMAAELHQFEVALKMAQNQLDAMKDKRRMDSEALQQWLFSNFQFLNARSESKSLLEIFADTPMKTPPSGAGECCGPKLLQAAYQRGWKPLSIAEFWYGKPKGGELRIHGEHYQACRGKCLPILTWMLQGLEVEPPLGKEYDKHHNFLPEIVYENEWFCVVNKPSGMLSVPGKNNAISVQRWLEEKYGVEREVKVAHRLDQDTSGLIIAPFGEGSFKIMQQLFAERKVRKTYIADLEGDYKALGIARSGQISLPLSPDWLDRPRQRVDFEGGKEAVTDYEFIDVKDGHSRILFHPHTGRTHQLRIHSASEYGLGMPILGDPLYGKNAGRDADRLHLHAHKIEFTFPFDAKSYVFGSPSPF